MRYLPKDIKRDKRIINRSNGTDETKSLFPFGTLRIISELLIVRILLQILYCLRAVTAANSE